MDTIDAESIADRIRAVGRYDPETLPPVGSEAGEDRSPAPKPKRGRPSKVISFSEGPRRSAAVEDRNVAPPASAAERQSARDLLQSIGSRFAENRQKSKSKAFEMYQRDLATNSGPLVMGGAVTLKELTVLLMDLEGFMKSTAKEGETPAVLLAKWLRGEFEVDE